ncbi:tereporin-Ca1-like [Paramacrobiotus metropolitanus]|uniref:tereporin-Ca1-like n=1 Tax=Paramacrobiotus metropolitanus TaxID=2943436 RepID=UPI002445CF22|nr:tereporin-Ca1-like [Paramacrobiotus metropolitanus]
MALRDGQSLTGTTPDAVMKAITHNVAATLEIRNFTRYNLTNPQTQINAGYVKIPAEDVEAGVREIMAMHKTDHTATGTSGVVSWLINGSNERLVIMWSAPYSFDFHSNWMGVGIQSAGFQLDAKTFNEMYKGEESWFRRKEFYKDTNQLVLQGRNIIVTATMGTTHKADIVVEVKPVQ